MEQAFAVKRREYFFRDPLLHEEAAFATVSSTTFANDGRHLQSVEACHFSSLEATEQRAR
jgi:hypothetical protein